MKRLFSYGVISLILPLLLIAFAACGTSQTEYDESAPEYAYELTEEAYEFGVAASEIRMLNTAVNDMRDARTAATALGAFANGDADAQESDASPEGAAMHNPLDLGTAPTRSQFTLLLNSITHNGQVMQEINLLRPGLDVTVYSDSANDLYYVEGGLRLIGMPFPLVNIGVDGDVLSAMVPLLYDRYFAVDLGGILDDLYAEFGQYLDMGLDYFTTWMESQNAASEAFANALDFEALLIDMVSDLLESATVELADGNYSVVIPAEDATAALSTLWDVIFDAYALLDVSTFNGDFEAEWAELLVEWREAFDYIRFTQDVTVSYVLEDGVLMYVEFEGVLGEYEDEVRLLIIYANNSGDHIGDIAWIFEMEVLDDSPVTIRVEYTSTLDTANGYYSRSNIALYFEDSWDAFSGELGWYLDRANDNSFSAGLGLSVNDYFEINFFAQGGMTHGYGYFNFDLDRLGFEANSSSFDFDIEFGAFFSSEVIETAAFPVIDAADQFFVLDATPEELDSVMQQIEENIAGLIGMFDLFGLGF